MYPHTVERQPTFKFLNVVEYWAEHGEGTEIPSEYQRRDGIFLEWDTERIASELTAAQRAAYAEELEEYSPYLYAFLPYQSSLWGELNQAATGMTRRSYLQDGLVISVNRQRMADVFEISASRFETLNRNLFVLVDFDGAKPDQGRKTVQEEVLDVATDAADRALQYIARDREFLKQPGEAPSPTQREVERDHEDWFINVQRHATENPLDHPPIAYRSEPLTEQDVVGLFNELAALGTFPGIKIFATSQSQTYDCLVSFEAPRNAPGLRYVSESENFLGLSSFVLGERDTFSTRTLTLDFKRDYKALANPSRSSVRLGGSR